MNEHDKLTQLDIELLDGYLHSLGISVIKQMLNLYQQQVKIYLNDIENAMLSNDTALWQEHCHKMKGAAGSVGLCSLHARLAAMEKSTVNTSEKTNQFAELTIHNEQALVAFNDWIECI